jgi:hypothetical protein
MVRTPAIAVAAAASLATIAPASVVPARFSVASMVRADGEILDIISATSNGLGLVSADLDSGDDVGTVITSLTASETSLTIASTMGVSTEYNGDSTGQGRYDFADSTAVAIDWSWLDLSVDGGWRILDSSGATVASLTFLAGQFTAVGGDFMNAQAGFATVNLGAGTYNFVAFYEADTMPTSSNVTFSFGAIPAPGAIALLGAAGLVGSFRRRS